MFSKLSVAIASAALCGLTLMSTQAKERGINGHKIAELLQTKFGVMFQIDGDNKIVAAIVDATPSDVGFTDKDIIQIIEGLSRIKSLQSVSFVSTSLDKERLAKLNELHKLTELELSGCKIQDDDFQAISGLKSLECLDLSHTPVSDAALSHLVPLIKLQLLYLDYTKVNGSGFKQLQELPELRNLYLRGLPITDESLKALQKIPSLRVVALNNTKISDDGLQHLSGLYRLVNLSLSDTKTTSEGKREFRKAHAIGRAKALKEGLIPKNYPELQGVSEDPRRMKTI